MPFSLGSRTYRVLTHPICFVAFGFGAGLSPCAPGTCGTLVAIPLYWLIHNLVWYKYLTILLIATLVGIWICAVAEQHMQIPDDAGIVWDEICGYGFTMLAAPHGVEWIVIGFILFRLFDIWKPWPIRQIERLFKGGVGIMLDDLAAAAYACCGIQLLSSICL